MTQSSSGPDADADDRRKHLDYIQAAIVRMSTASASAKSWLLPVVTATYGYALTKKQGEVAVLGVAATLLIALLDANYLRQERAYRRLYNVVARKIRIVPPFTLDPADTNDIAASPRTWKERARRRLASWVPELGVWLSWSIAPFYGTLAAVGVLAVVFAR